MELQKHKAAISSIVNDIVKHYTESNDFKGLANYNLYRYGITEYEINDVLKDLIKEGKIAIITSRQDDNPHIIRFGFSSIAEQLDFFNNTKSNTSFCIYPTRALLEQVLTETSDDIKFPFRKMLRYGYPQFKALYFSWDVLYRYATDPRYEYEFSDYSGSITTSPNSGLRDDQIINLKTFGIGRDDSNSHVVVAFPRYLAELPSSIQIEWEAKLITNQDGCKVLQNYLDNQFRCSWNFPQTVYRSLLEEIQNINRITETVFMRKFFRKEYKKAELRNFDMITLPSNKEYSDFVLLLEKILVSNIDDKFFDTIGISRKDSEGNIKGSLKCLSEWLDEVCPQARNEIVQPLKDLRKKRQKPAHEIGNNTYDSKLVEEQQKLTEPVFWSLFKLRKLLQSHPKANNINLEHDKTNEFIII